MRLLLPVLLLLTGCATAQQAPRDEGLAPCPDRAVVGAVPADPTADTGGRLVAAVAPREALVCRYAGGALSGSVELAPEGLAAVPHDLLLPVAPSAVRACPPAPGEPVLLRLAYPDGAVWLATTAVPDPCTGSTDGARRSPVPLGDVLLASADAGRWTVPPLPDADQRCVPGRTGRHGQETALLPPGAVRLVLCRVAGDGVTRRTASPQQQAVVQDVLDEPVAVLDPRTCTGGGEQHELVAEYARGPAVLVEYGTGCRPQVDNGSLRADLDPADRQRLEQVLRDTGA